MGCCQCTLQMNHHTGTHEIDPVMAHFRHKNSNLEAWYRFSDLDKLQLA